MRKRWKRSFVTALSMALAVGNCVPAMAAPTGWRESAAGWQYVNADGSVQKGWFQDTKGDWYFLDYNTGVMKTGWIKPADGNWYFMDYHTGSMKTGWIKPMDGNWYYLNPVSNGTKGAMKTGWVQTSDSKWYYLNASGVMQTGTITVGDKVWTLDASGAWNGKDATGVTYVSSGKGGGSHTSSTKTPAIETDEEGNVTINSTNFVASSLPKEITGNLTINAKLTEDQKIELSGITVKGNLTIGENVGEGDVTLNDVIVEGETLIQGGGSDTVTFNRCTFFNKIVARKKLPSGNSSVKPLHINFGKGTKFEKDATIEAEENLRVSVESEVVVPEIIAKASILLDGKGKVTTLNITTTVSIVIAVNVTKVSVEKEAAPEITVKKDEETGVVGTVGAVEGDGADSTVITGDGKVEGYYEITLNPNGGYWVVEDIVNNTTKNEDTAKIVKVKAGESIGTVLSADGFVLPVNDGKEFSGWYTAADGGTKVDMAAGKDDVTNLYAGWATTKVAVTSAEITGATDGVAKVGDTLTAVENEDATGQLTYQWKSCATEDGTYTDIAGATKSTYTVQEADAGKFVKVTISGDNNSSVESKAVQIEKKTAETEKTDLVVSKVTATVSGAAVASVGGDVTNNEVTLTVKAASGSSVTVKGISVEAKDNAELTTTPDKSDVEVKAGEEVTINVTCKPVEADKYNQETVTVKVVIKVEN